MLYFYFSLFLSLVLCLCLLLLLLKRLKINVLNQNMQNYSYFLPIIIALFLSAFIIFDLQARILDLSYILSNNSLSRNLSGEDFEQEGNKVFINGESYYLPSAEVELDKDKLYRFVLTRYSRICLSVNEIDSLNEVK